MRLRCGERRAELVVTLTLLLASLASVRTALGHGRSVSHSSWEIDPEGARVEVRMTALDLSRLAPALGQAGSADPVASYLVEHLRLLAGDQPCRLTGPASARNASAGWVVYEWQLRCPTTGRRQIVSDLLVEANPAHIHFARLRLPDGRVVERVLAGGRQASELPAVAGSSASPTVAGEAVGTPLLGYVRLGVEHISSGWDHLAFVLALLLLARTLGEVATLVTAFTIAHSVTLGLAVLGAVRPEAGAVEALIGFSIALVAAENSWLLAGRDRWIPAGVIALLAVVAWMAGRDPAALTPLALLGLGVFSLCHFALLDRAARPGLLRAAIAFAFGLVHGFGFAGVLAEMELPRQRTIAALLGFNLGVEAGQLGVVALIWPMLRAVSRFGGERCERWGAELGSAAISGLGLFWFVTRCLAAGRP